MLTEDLQDIFKNFSNDGKLGGIYLATPTGKILDEDSTFIEVLIYGKSFYAKPCMSFGSFNVPNKEWLDEFKDEILVWVAFENGNSAHPVYLGIAPKDNKAPKGSYPRIKTWKSVEFDYYFDDKLKVFEVKHKNGNRVKIDGQTNEISIITKTGQKISIKDLILLGKVPVNSAVLGEPLVTALSSILTISTSMATAMSSATIIVNPTTYVGIMDPAVISTLTQLNTQYAQVLSSISTILSKSVKLE